MGLSQFMPIALIGSPAFPTSRLPRTSWRARRTRAAQRHECHDVGRDAEPASGTEQE